MFLQLTPAFITFILTVLVAPILIFILKKLKLTQPIRVELPAAHQEKKGTPLMAGRGLFFVEFISHVCIFRPVRVFFSAPF